ncbi:acyloxyacyl hydrolase [Aliidiomarina soli]|nr:acyloxyacyl hydrolase [Aliidiomarina soli]
MNNFFVVIFATVTGYLNTAVAADNVQEASIEILKGSGSIQGLRVAYKPWLAHLADIAFVGRASIYLEASLNLWRHDKPTLYDNNIALAFSPVIRKEFTTLIDYPVSWELGIGISVLSERQFGGKDLGSYFQFEDRLGLVLHLDDSKHLALRYIHYSNGGFSNNNPGMDFLNLAYSWQF